MSLLISPINALLVVLLLRAGRVVIEHDLCSLVRVGASIIPALHRRAHELGLRAAKAGSDRRCSST